ncbi:MAG: His-Xaa-Ser system protein HxsD [Elusimicrobia bacterium]|nr:His-Xaa-Ser system protein HxsD [Elusimicrobiota bacterium]
MEDKNKLVFTLNMGNYSLEGVYQAAYALLDRLYFYFDKKNETTLLVEIKPKGEIEPSALEALKGEFLNELLNSELRVIIAKRTRKVREALIAQALIGASAGTDDYTEDPLGIAQPWEEKYGAGKKSEKKEKAKP